MRKRSRGRKFSLKTDQRKALLKTLAGSLILKEKIQVTEAKAKELSGYTEKLITVAVRHLTKTDKNQAELRLLAKTFAPVMLKKLVNEIAPRYKETKGGYTRVIKLVPRKSDGSKMAIIELTKRAEKPVKS